MKANTRIKEWFHKHKQSGSLINLEDVCFLMVQVRHLIEKAGSPPKYRIASFYADWIVHSTLDRSTYCYEVLRDITHELVKNLNPTRPDFTREISSIIGLPQLRSELKNLFIENGLPIVLFDYLENWKFFVCLLLGLLDGTPISFPKTSTGKSKNIKEEILAIQRPYNITVKALAIINREGVYHWIIAVYGDKKLNIMGQIEIAEDNDAFLPLSNISPE